MWVEGILKPAPSMTPILPKLSKCIKARKKLIVPLKHGHYLSEADVIYVEVLLEAIASYAASPLKEVLFRSSSFHTRRRPFLTSCVKYTIKSPNHNPCLFSALTDLQMQKQSSSSHSDWTMSFETIELLEFLTTGERHSWKFKADEIDWRILSWISTQLYLHDLP